MLNSLPASSIAEQVHQGAYEQSLVKYGLVDVRAKIAPYIASNIHRGLSFLLDLLVGLPMLD